MELMLREPFWGIRLNVVPPSQVSVGGCHCQPLVAHGDERGYLFEAIRIGEPNQVAMSYISMTRPGFARDIDQWHVHLHQTDHFVVLSGMAMFGLAQEDPPLLQRVLLSVAEPFLLTVPPGVLHCFRTIGENVVILANYPDRVYDPGDELRIKFEEVLSPWEVYDKNKK